MGADEPRRSTRTRKPATSYADEQQDDAVASIRPKKRSRAESDAADDADFSAVNIALAVEPSKSTDVDGPVKKKSKKATKQKEETTAQPYGHPAKGTLIRSGTGWRKMPQIWEVPEKQFDNGKKSAWLNDAAEVRIAREVARIKKLAPDEAEKRLKPYVDELPEYYDRFLESAYTQKMFILDRKRSIEDCHANHDDCPCEELRLAGSKGSVYNIRISHIPTCTCPVGVFSKTGHEKQCKHILYVLHHVLKAPGQLKYQAAFLTSELKTIFGNSAPLPQDAVDENCKDGNQKEVEGDCPICFIEFEEGEKVVWCKAACGNNIHSTCFEQWARVRPGNVTCPFCRTDWQFVNDDKKTTLARVNDTGVRDRGGYLNVRDQLDYD